MKIKPFVIPYPGHSPLKMPYTKDSSEQAGGPWGLEGGTWRDSDSRFRLFIKHTRDRDPIETLHLGKGGGQDLSRAHGGHVAAGLG